MVDQVTEIGRLEQDLRLVDELEELGVEHLAGNEPRNVVGRGRLSQPRGDAGQELGDATERELVLGHHGPRLGRGHGLGGHAADREAGGGEELGEHANRGSHP